MSDFTVGAMELTAEELTLGYTESNLECWDLNRVYDYPVMYFDLKPSDRYLHFLMYTDLYCFKINK